MQAIKLSSIGARLFLATFVLCGVFFTYALWSVSAISQSSEIVKDTYDRPLQALNYARSANAGFYRMRFVAMSGDQDAVADEAILIKEDLEVAYERALSEQSRNQIRSINNDFEAWQKALGADGVNSRQEAELAQRLTVEFDIITETMAADSFLERQKSVSAVTASRNFALMASIAALLFGALTAVLLRRQIVRPLQVAARAADRISQGDFKAAIPDGGNDETGALLRSMNVMQASITKMIAKEEARRKSAEGRMVDALDNANAAILLLDEDWRLVFANREVFNCFPEASEKLDTGVTLAEALETLQIQFHNVEGTGESVIAGLEDTDEVHLADGRWLRVTRSQTRDDGVVLIWTDISDIKEREEHLKIATAHAEAANATKTKFLANISHELKTPLHSIIGFSEVIHSESFGPLGSDQYKEYSQFIVNGGKRLLGLIMEVLELAREEDSKADIEMGPVRVDTIFSAVKKDLEAEAQKANIDLQVENPETPLWIWGDSDKLVHAVRNILSNGIKFSSDGGLVRVTAVHDDAFIKISISDQGAGMRAQDIPVALSAFDQVDGALSRRHEGAGTGLPFAKSIIERHGGRLEIESVPEKGTTVTIYLLDSKSVAHGSLSIPAGKISGAA